MVSQNAAHLENQATLRPPAKNASPFASTSHSFAVTSAIEPSVSLTAQVVMARHPQPDAQPRSLRSLDSRAMNPPVSRLALRWTS